MPYDPRSLVVILSHGILIVWVRALTQRYISRALYMPKASELPDSADEEDNVSVSVVQECLCLIGFK